MREQKRSSSSPVWTAMDVLVSYATLKGWVTAKAGRPDINRAGNASEYIYSISFLLFVNCFYSVKISCPSSDKMGVFTP